MLTGFSHCHTKDDCPRQNPDIIGLDQGVDWIINKVEEEIAQNLADAFWGTDLRAGCSQLDAIAFKPPTKIWPRRLMALACGKMRASRAPVTIPIEIRLIRLARFQAERIR